MSRRQVLALSIALLAGIGVVLFAHVAIKLPSEPFWSTITSIYENYALAIAVAFSVPYPMWVAGVVLVIMMALVYGLSYRLFGRWFG
jgi:hypothetical protein